MGLLNRQIRSTATPARVSARIRPQPPRRFVSEFENEIRQLYVGTIDEPIPPRLINILRTGLVGHKP